MNILETIEKVAEKNLTELNLPNNNIKKFPKEIFQLTNLTYLKLSNNKIKKLPKEIF